MRSAVFNVCVGLTAGLLLVAARPAEAISVDIQGIPATVTAGQNFSVDVVISGITDEIISAWDIDVAFNTPLLNNGVLTLLTIPFGGNDDTIFDASFSAGLTDAFLVSLLSDAELTALQCPGDVCAATLTIASLSFTASADGVPEISLVNWGLDNDIKCADAKQCYPALPEPGSLALLGLGMLGMGLTRRRRGA